MILIDIMKSKRKAQPRKPSGIPRLVRIPPDIDAWLIEKARKDQDAYYVQDVIRNILRDTRDAERQQEQAA